MTRYSEDACRMLQVRAREFAPVTSVPQQDIDNQELLFRGAASQQAMMNSVAAWYPGMQGWAISKPPDEDSWSRITRLRRAKTRSAHASCWSMGDESEPLWRAFCADNDCR